MNTTPLGRLAAPARARSRALPRSLPASAARAPAPSRHLHTAAAPSPSPRPIRRAAVAVRRPGRRASAGRSIPARSIRAMARRNLVIPKPGTIDPHPVAGEKIEPSVDGRRRHRQG